MCDRDNRGGGLLAGLILGAAIGAGAVWFLTSTEEGKVVRKKIAKKSQDVIDDLTDIVDDLEQKGEEFRDKAKEIQVELEERAATVKGEVAEKAQEKLTEIEELRQRGEKAIKYFTKGGKSLA